MKKLFAIVFVFAMALVLIPSTVLAGGDQNLGGGEGEISRIQGGECPHVEGAQPAGPNN